MPKGRRLKINISKEIGSVSSILILPKDADALLVLAHGAGAGMEHAFMQALAQQLATHKIATLRFNFAYMELGNRAPDRPKKAHPAILAAVKKAMKYAEGMTLLGGGKSFGGRMFSQVAAAGELPEVDGLVYFGFPLHAPGKQGIERAAHLADIKVPQLFLQGTRDALAKMDLMKKVCKKLKKGKLVKIEGGDHSFKTLKSAALTHEVAIEKLAQETAAFAKSLKK